MPLHWEKELTKSDAQQKTQGSRMPFLRFTKSGIPHDHKTWFRNVFFGGLNWHPVHTRGIADEAADVDVHVTIDGNYRGVRSMVVDHGGARAENHSAPTTHLHYDGATRAELEALNLVGRTVVVERDDNGEYHFST